MALQFGTDGLRGVANSELTPELVLALGRAAARHLGGTCFVIGADTRQSSPMLARAFAAGVAAEGVDVIDIGVLTTPGVAFLAASLGHPGAVVSASHNPYTDNGIKLISPSGTKIADGTERAIEEELAVLFDGTRDHLNPTPVRGTRVGAISAGEHLVANYVEHLLASAKSNADHKLRVVCDCANGASSPIAKSVFERFGADVVVIGAQPDGVNINEGCGSTHPEHLVAEVLAQGADLGLGFDGDADRLIAVAEDGTIVDGDQLIALFAMDLSSRNELLNHGVVVTVMSNLGLRRRLEEAGITVVETPIGDRYVADALSERDFVLGGEQSGHIIFRRNATTGDGLLTGLKLIELVAMSGRGLSDLAKSAMTRLPQELRTIAVADPALLDASTPIWQEVKQLSNELSDNGRILLRRSGTESAVRIMVEAPTEERVHDIVERLAALVHQELGDKEPAPS